MNRLAYRVVATERERNIRYTTADHGVRQVFFDRARGLDVIDGVVVVFLDTGGNREDVRIEYDVFRRETDFIDENVVRTLADIDLAFERVGLAGFVESHDNDGRTVFATQVRMMNEGVFAFLQRNRVHDWFALAALQPGLDDFPLGGVDHQRHARNVRFRCNQVQVGGHRRLAVEHGLVHVDVDHLCAVLDLVETDVQRLGVIVFQD